LKKRVEKREPRLLLTCEHGGNAVPGKWRPLFEGRRKLLASHRGWDPGALPMARQLARQTGSALVAATTTRLLVDLNRSPHNPAAFSDITRPLPRAAREELLDRYHRPHWDRVRAALAGGRGPVVHVAVHSFTPVWHGETRRVGIGLLYDPGRIGERTFAIAWQRRLACLLPGVEIRRNAPYRGDADGLTTGLRREYAEDRYLGIELEMNQRLLASAAARRALTRGVCDTLVETLRATGEARHPR
jgi:predicted N-formylglutamate amidohydrolase